MWVEDNKILYQFYEKPMVSKLVIMEQSALSTKVKIQVLAQEVVRRRRNTHMGEKREKVDEIMTRFMMKLKYSGYNRETRWEILKSGTRRYNRLVKEEREGKRTLNRPRWEGGHGRYWSKMMKKNNWYKRKGKNTDKREVGDQNGREHRNRREIEKQGGEKRKMEGGE